MKRGERGYLLAETLDILGRGLGVEDVDDDHLGGGHAGRQHQALVVAVHHDHHADGAGGETPAVLPDKLALYE